MTSTLVQFPCTGGINQAQRAEVVEPGETWLNLENVRQYQRGAYDKRFGYGVRGLARLDGSSRSAGYKLLQHNGWSCVLDGHQLDVYSPAANVEVGRSRVPEVMPRRRAVMTRKNLLSPFGLESGDASIGLNEAVYANGYYVILTIEMPNGSNVQINAVVLDATTGETVMSSVVNGSTQGSRMINVRVIAVGNNVVAVWDDGGANIKASRLSVASASSINTGWATAVTLATDLGQSFTLDVGGLTTKFALVYGNATIGTARVTLKTYDPTVNALTQLASTTATTSATNVDCVSVDGNESDQIWIAWAFGSLSAAVVEGHGAVTISSVTSTAQTILGLNGTGSAVKLGVSWTGTNAGWVTVAQPDPTVAAWMVGYSRGFTNTAGATVGAGTVMPMYGFFPISRPFVLGGRTYLEYAHDDNASTAAVLTDVSSNTVTARPVGWVAPRLQSTDNFRTPARHVMSVSATKMATLQVIKSSAVSASLCIVEWDFASATRWQPATAAGCLMMSGGVPAVYDGQQVNELSFMVPPRVSTTVAGTGITGTFSYTAIYEYVDAAGNVIWSDTAPVQAQAAANQTVTVRARTLTMTWRDGQDSAPLDPKQLRRVRIKIYRTQTGGGLFYLLTTLLNNPANATVSFADSTTDATLITGAQLYRSPGVAGTAQPRQCPPALLDWCEYNGMIVGLSEDGTTIFWTAQHVVGEGIYFSDVFQQPIEADGAHVAVEVQDGTCYVFKRRAIYAVAGDPPSDNGAVGGLGSPRRLAVDVGCIDPRSVVVTAKGIFFQAERGLCLLTRAQTVVFIGEAIKPTTEAFPVCTAATLDSAQGRVYFELAQGETANQVTGTGRTAVYNLTLECWESFDRRYNNAQVADTPAQSAALIYTGTAWRYAWLGTDGRVYVEDQTTYLDPGPNYVVKLGETPHVKVGGLQGNQAVNAAKLIGKQVTPHAINLALRYDYDVYAATQTHTDAQIAAVGLPNVQLEIRPDDNAPGMAVAMKVSDGVPTSGAGIGTGQGSIWFGVLFDVTPSEGSFDLPDAAR